jgi:exonuclease III
MTNPLINNEINSFLTEQRKIFQSDAIRFGTHNTRGITRTIDQEMLIQEIWDKKIDILGLSETKLTPSNQTFAFNSSKDKYKCFPSSCPNNPRGAGVLLLIHKDLEKYIAQVDKIEGHLVAINLLSKRHKTWIAQVYLPCNKQKSMAVQKKIQTLIRNKIQQRYQIIIMGDFNAALNPRYDRSNSKADNSFSPSEDPEAPIFNFLLDWNLVDLHQLWENPKPSHI